MKSLMFASCLALSGCAVFAPPAADVMPVSPRSVVGNWVMVEFDGAPVGRDRLALNFLPSERVTGSVACNRFNARYRAVAQRIRFFDATTEKRVCVGTDDALIARARATILTNNKAFYSRNGRTLTLANFKHEVRFQRR